MKYAAVGLGLIAVAACFLACSGSTLSSGSNSNPNPDAGVDTDAGTDICKVDADCAPRQCDVTSGKCVECRTASDCGLEKECTAGSCKDATCVPNSTFCRSGSVSTCGADGSTSAVSQHCSSDQFCLEKDNTATCSATACFPGDAMCAGNLATFCLPDGSGPKPGGNDCAAAKQACYSGDCRDQVCAPGKKLCDNGVLYLCSDAGTSRALLNTCAAGQVCDADAGACQPKVCEPGKLGCDSTRVVTCNAAGSGWKQSGPDCAANKGVCSAGACLPLTCSPGQSFCQDNKVYRCSSDGTSSSVSTDCSLYQDTQCTSLYGYPQCTTDACSPGVLSCNGNVLAKCKADGSTWESGGTDCSLTNSNCVDAKCVAPVCTPNGMFCSKGNVQQCDYQGLTSNQAQFCITGTTCKPYGSMSAECDPTPCFPDSDGCVGEKLGHCSEDGLSVGGTLTDCAAASKVCTPQGCVASAVTTLATANQIGAGYDGEMLTNILVVENARKLTTIEAYLSLPTNRTLTWVVYELTNANQDGEFDLKYQKATPGTGAGFQSSGAISVQLKAGKTYAIGVSVSGGNFVYYYDTSSIPPSLNFAHAIDSADQSFGSSFYQFNPGQKNSLLYNDRLTTTLP